MIRSIGLLALAAFTGPLLLADVVFNDSNLNLSSYTQTAAYTTSGTSLTIANGGGGVQVTVNAHPNGMVGVAQGAVGILNNTFTYNPSSKGAIETVSFSMTASFSDSLQIGPGYLPWSTQCAPLIEQDGKYYTASTSGESYAGGSTGSFTCSIAGMRATDFVQYNLTTGATSAGNPNFSGDPISFGILFTLSAFQDSTLGQAVSAVNFDLVTASTPPALSASPAALNFFAVSDATPSGQTQQQTIAVANIGGSAAGFGPTVQNKSDWLSVSPVFASGLPGPPYWITATVNTQKLNPGVYRDVIQLQGTGVSESVPVTVFVANPGPALYAGPGGFTFTMTQSAGSTFSQNLVIANQGSLGTTMSWSAGPVTGLGIPNGNFLSFSTTSGQTQSGALSNVALTLNSNASTLQPGVYYELIQVSAPGAQNPLQYATAVLDVVPPGTLVFPEVAPAGLVFTGSTGSVIPPQRFVVSWSSTTAQDLVPIAYTDDGSNWLNVSPGDAKVSATSAGVFSASVNTAGLSAGVHTATIQLNDVIYGTVNVTLILTPGGANAGPRHSEAILSCTPSTVVLTETGIPGSFTVPAGWPSDLIATMTDDCGNSVNNGAISANFSNGDPPLALTPQGSAGQYSSVWQPSKQTNANITLTGSAPKLTTASIQVSGFVTANQAPVLAPNGILNNLNPLVGAPLAPGTVAAAFGNGLAASQKGVSPNQSPLPNQYQNTELVIGGSLAPLYFLSSGQLNVEIPAELAPLQQVPAVAIANNALSVPVTLTTVPMAPGVAVNADGSVIAQDSNFNLITAANPAHPKEPIVIYVVGMGATNPPVASGQPAPGLNAGDTLAQAVTQPVVQVNNQSAHIYFAGLTPGAIGLYQINFQVPDGTSAGSATLTVTQGDVSANATTLPVAVP